MKIIQILTLLLTMTAPVWAESLKQPLLVNIRTAKGFNDQQYEKLLVAKLMVEQVVNSAAFKDRVLRFSVNGQLGFVQNNGMNNEQIYELLMNGAEKFPNQTSVDHFMDFDLILYKPKWYQSKKVLGYTNQNTSIIQINKNFYNQAEINEIAMNLVHEWTHKMGYGHDFNKTSRRQYSVPYGIGYIVRDLGSLYFQQLIK